MVETDESVAESPSKDEDETEPSVTELLERLGREVSILAVCESRLAASRHAPGLRRAARDVAAALVVALALLTAFALANVAAVYALSTTMAGWAAATVLAAAWAAVGVVLALYLWARTRRVRGMSAGNVEDARADAERAVRETLEQLAPAITREIALAAMPMATGMASGVVDAGEEIIEGADEVIDALTENMPGGGVVNQVWDFVLMPGRLGVRVATTVLKRDSSS